MNKNFLYGLLVFVAGSSYGFIVPVVKVALSFGVDVNDFLPLQYAVALVVMFVVLAGKWRRVNHPKGIEYLKLSLLGVFAACTSLCYYRAVTLLPSAVALTMLFQFVWIGPLIEAIVYKKLPSRSTVIAIAIVLIGTVCAAGVLDQGIESLDTFGIGVGLLSAVFYSLFLFFSGRIGVEHSIVVRSTMLAIGGLITTTAVNPTAFSYAIVNPDVLPFALLMGALGVLIPTSLIAYASPKLAPSVVSIMASSELPVGVLAAWAIVGDVPTPLGMTGVVLILVGIVVNQLPSLQSSLTARGSCRNK